MVASGRKWRRRNGDVLLVLRGSHCGGRVRKSRYACRDYLEAVVFAPTRALEWKCNERLCSWWKLREVFVMVREVFVMVREVLNEV